MPPDTLEFEEPIAVLFKEIEALSMLPPTPERQGEIDGLRRRIESIRSDLYAHLTPWQRVLVARHAGRPTVLDYVTRLFTGFTEISGDRRFADDHAIITGFAAYKDQPVLVVGHHKGGGGDTKQKIYRNFGYARPEGYRKALRAMKLAEKFRRPVIAFIDTPAAYPGVESEERGIAEAIAFNLREMAALEVPIVVVVHGEGGSGGALGIAIGDRILMHEFAIYSVIPPEGCAAILWRDANRKIEAAEALKLTGPDLLRLGVIDEIVPEPVGGAHTNPELAATLLSTPRSPARSPKAARSIPPHGWSSDTGSSGRWAIWGCKRVESRVVLGSGFSLLGSCSGFRVRFQVRGSGSEFRMWRSRTSNRKREPERGTLSRTGPRT
jgi:acetyl-CoA carboxylase carboxyl transferase subunit alpha